ncbi:potassium-transporting ATPase subunit KdpC [Corynebacterium variabile]|uniref:potassium-transporting ATPase subunit KdpC n=1 Tax=Corynebacterium variabile TaxID=1727 RepID=UPI002897A6F2|nr:potassium-transporting ATPase subunit KdpC [Corynebacterium variabile]
MTSSIRRNSRALWAGTRILIVLTLILGIGYPLLITGIGQALLPDRANGGLLRDHEGNVVGSSLIGQSFTDSQGAPLKQYFQSRPSAAGDGYDASASAGSNLGPENPELVASITERRAAVASLNGVAEDSVPADAVTASASGLDPDISPEYAQIQVKRVAEARGIDASTVRGLVKEYTEGPDMGYIGDPVVNVVELNLALDSLEERR